MAYEISTSTAVFIGVAVVWDVVWKGFAAWRAARHNQSVWFVLLLVVNSIGVLPILYLLFFQRKADYRAKA